MNKQTASADELLAWQFTELLAVLREIVHAYEDTYDADSDVNGHWIGAASIPVATMERACALLNKQPTSVHCTCADYDGFVTCPVHI